MTYKEIIQWYDSKDIDWRSFDTKDEAIAEMDRLADKYSDGTDRADALKNAISTGGFQSNSIWQTKVNQFGSVAVKELDNLKVEVDNATTIREVNNITTKREINKQELQEYKQEKITEIREEQQLQIAQSQALEGELLSDIEDLFNTASDEDRLAALQLWDEDIGQFDSRISELEDLNQTAARSVRSQIRSYRSQLNNLPEPEL